MKKKMLAVLLTVVVSMTAVACGDKASEEQDTETAKEPTETAQQDTTAAEAVTARPVTSMTAVKNNAIIRFFNDIVFPP